MPQLDVQDAMIRRLTDEMVPLVEQITGWDLQAPLLRVRVLPRDEGYEEILMGRLRGAGVPVDVTAARTVLDRMIEYVVENTVLAAYESSTQQVYVIRENVDDSNLDGLRLVLAHELVHRGQHVNHGDVFARVDRITRELFQILTEGGSVSLAWRKMKEAQKVMTLLESHAQSVQNLLRQTRFPAAEIESHFNLPAILMRVFGQMKLAQYVNAAPAVVAAMGNGTMESLYLGLAKEAWRQGNQQSRCCRQVLK